ncbi:membrane lipoprotein lipid attachment site-containing protein [Cytobacillus oceanisediminis]|uniref:membrane lipoprotein lipid attachment site-containing protein n=1 Tax=Cytobacillus oceanisediminis TaxID=665099 RepID=UPI001FB20CE2|nr:membrane lipoprotein lipid attachment site-containing protein [Cytobacillus oceanisediminis]UOE58113.1 membrane lipoprotein lipid attachment site-containing protein [Cytobacillus oceanisediminis]
MKKILIAFLLLSVFALSACNQDTGSDESYQVVTVLNDGMWSYDSNESPESYEQGSKIATISKKTDPEVTPGTNESNYFEKGTKIYSIKGKDELIMAVEPSGKKSILRKNEN